jgi:hypothetical protein
MFWYECRLYQFHRCWKIICFGTWKKKSSNWKKRTGIGIFWNDLITACRENLGVSFDGSKFDYRDQAFKMQENIRRKIRFFSAKVAAAGSRRNNPLKMRHSWRQGCQIFLSAIYQNGENYTKLEFNLPNGNKIYQLTIQYVCKPNGHKMY